MRHAWMMVIACVVMVGCASGGRDGKIDIEYPVLKIDAITGKRVGDVSPIVSGKVKHYQVEPSLPDGFVFNEETGVISGVPVVPSLKNTYTIVASNDSCAVSTKIDIVVAGLVPDLRFKMDDSIYECKIYGGFTACPPFGNNGVELEELLCGPRFIGPLWMPIDGGLALDANGIFVSVPLVNNLSSVITSVKTVKLSDLVSIRSQGGYFVSSLSVKGEYSSIIFMTSNDGRSGYASDVKIVRDEAELLDWAQRCGNIGSIITAISASGSAVDGGNAAGPMTVISSSRGGDQGTYDVRVVSGSMSELKSTLSGLGNMGFRVTAFGSRSIGSDQFAAVLSRRSDDETPRSIVVEHNKSLNEFYFSHGYAEVGHVIGGDPNMQWIVWQR